MVASGIHLQGLPKSGEVEIIESHNVKIILFWIKLDLLAQLRLSIHPQPHPHPSPGPWPVRNPATLQAVRGSKPVRLQL